MKNILLIAVAVLAGISIAGSMTNSNEISNPVTTPITQGQEAIDRINEVVEDRNASYNQELTDMQAQQARKSAQESIAASDRTPGFLAYADAKISSIQGDIVLAFLADWYPSSRAFKSDVNASVSDIPEDLTIIDVDYDRESELKKKYEITAQHTFVQIDQEGNMIKTWRGDSTLESLLSELE